ncbi:N-acetylmuramoyl-L-alanine amidase [Tenacibaculum jejuense]|uniref:N-acetylmuramoyl-L-alanine amidase n=1 Tax=Tenacibaculum jejuense TaxID=584609 RepID=A0A238U6D8_9FLAO|nr:N-acetylmuramoyl-L-alanine amidase [Tenacibaculum jejuense]SNR14771.1 N-acetylmuramoyl-L-alanine amidase (modular protein) [Tenacibaculum jejuense]
MKKTSFREKLIEVRTSKGLTQTEVANLCNISLRTIQRIESGTVTPRAYTIKQISEALGFDFFKVYDDPDTYTEEETKTKNNFQTSIGFVKDLFNLKTNTMKKVSILSSFCFLIATFIFLFSNKSNAQTSKKIEPKLKITSESELIIPVKIAFTNDLTLDDLTQIKKDLLNKGIIVDYKKLEFDKNNKLQAIGCFVDCNDGFNGYFFTNNLNGNRKYGFYRDYDINSPSPFGTGTLKKTIVLDVGHGGIDTGSFSKGFQEKEITLQIANKIRTLSKENDDIEIFLTRSTDQFITLNKRVAFINALKPDYVISLHIASSGLEEMYGINFFTSNKNVLEKESLSITKKIAQSISKKLKINTVQNMNSHLLKHVEYPATLLEIGHLSNPNDYNLLTSDEDQNKIADAIFSAIREVL